MVRDKYPNSIFTIYWHLLAENFVEIVSPIHYICFYLHIHHEIYIEPICRVTRLFNAVIDRQTDRHGSRYRCRKTRYSGFELLTSTVADAIHLMSFRERDIFFIVCRFLVWTYFGCVDSEKDDGGAVPSAIVSSREVSRCWKKSDRLKLVYYWKHSSWLRIFTKRSYENFKYDDAETKHRITK